MVLSAFNVTIAEDALARQAGTDEFGTELAGLIQAARQLGCAGSAQTMSYSELQTVPYPIVYLDGAALGRGFACTRSWS